MKKKQKHWHCKQKKKLVRGSKVVRNSSCLSTYNVWRIRLNENGCNIIIMYDDLMNEEEEEDPGRDGAVG